MARFNTNQNRQFYVAKAYKKLTGVDGKSGSELKDLLTTVGDITFGKTKDGELFFQQVGEGGMVRSDVIDIKSITDIKYTKAEAMKRPLKKYKIVLDANVNGGAPIAGQDYIINLQITNAFGGGLDDKYLKFGGSVYAKTGMDADGFYDEMLKQLELSFRREQNQWFEFSKDAEGGIVITEKELSWKLGKMSDDGIGVDIFTPTIEEDHIEVQWAVVTDETPSIADAEEGEYVGNGKKTADMEYFFHGERGDQYRDSIGDKMIDTKYMVDPTKEYDFLDIHFAYQGSCEDIQKSEKDITIVWDSKSPLTSLISDLETELGYEIPVVPESDGSNQSAGGEGGDNTNTTNDNEGGDDNQGGGNGNGGNTNNPETPDPSNP